MRKLILLPILILITFSGFCQGIQSELDRLVEENEIPGLNFSIIYPDGKQENFTAGYSDKENQVPMSAELLMFSGSIGKTYAATIIFQLADEGKLKLDDRFLAYFPNLDWLKELPNIEDITVEMLLSHTSGLPRYVMMDGFWTYVMANPDKVWSYQERLKYVWGKPAVHPAGEGWAYSDTNYILLGMLIELLTGNYYYDEVSSRLLDPYELSETYPSLKRDIPELAMGYSSLKEWEMPEKVISDGLYVFNPQMEWTGGGFYCSTPDLARWAKLYFDGGLISDTLLKKMTTPSPYGKDLGGNTSYGMGSFIYITTYGVAWGHTGTMPGYNSIFAWFPEEKIAVALQVNCDYAGNKMALIDYLQSILTYI